MISMMFLKKKTQHMELSSCEQDPWCQAELVKYGDRTQAWQLISIRLFVTSKKMSDSDLAIENGDL